MKRRGIIKNLIIVILVWVIMFGYTCPVMPTLAKDDFVANYTQTVYNQQNGLGSSEISCLYQSASGYVWIGTNSGLYRSKGSEFTSINLWDTDRTDVYSITSITQDMQGRMWIGTANYGLFCIEDGATYHFQQEYYNGIKTINDICVGSDGKVYVATADGFFVVSNNSSGDKVLASYIDEAMAGSKFSHIENFGDDIWAIRGGNTICILGVDGAVGSIDTTDITIEELNSLSVINDKIYCGTTGRDLLEFSGATSYSVYQAGIDNINVAFSDETGRLWCGGDTGIGYFKDRENFVKLDGCEIDTYITDALFDYEGNFWFASGRMGVLLLSRSKFTDFNMLTGMPETMVNVVHEYNNMKYIGTEDGLLIYDATNQRIYNDLTDTLQGISIRHMMSDSSGNLWISTYRRYGLIRITKTGEVLYIGRGSGLPSIVVNCSHELSDKNIAVATENGIAILSRYGNVIKTYTNDFLSRGNITCLNELSDGKLMVGTEGSGVYVINTKNDEIVNYDTSAGLNSNSITCMVNGNEGVWIGTDNGLCFYNESFRNISNIEYTNSIYDILIDSDRVYIVGSRGLLITNETELIGSQGISGRYFDFSDGQNKYFNAISNSLLDDNDVLYLCCNTGICTIDTNNIFYNTVPPKIKVTAIDVDGSLYEFDDLAGSLNIDNDASRITIDFAVFSYSNRSNISVEYYLDGFDDEPIKINGNDTMKAVYTNLDGGEYRFVINAYNGDGTKCVQEVSFSINKEKSFLENRWAKILIVSIVLVAIFLVAYFVLRIVKALKSKNSEYEQLSMEHEKAIKSSSAKNDYLANMSNEIKTPINAIVARADELMRSMHPEDDKQQLVKNIYDAGNDIIEKVDDIILLAKIEAGKINVVNAPYSLSDLIYSVSEEAAKKIADQPIKFYVEMGDDTREHLVGDFDKLRDILSRVIDNSIKYTKEGSITLSVDSYSYNTKNHQDMVRISFSVSDTGVGIPENKLSNIFEVSNIADNVKGSHTGIGVGLAISKGYADLIGADIEAESVYGAGSTFLLSLDQKITNVTTSSNQLTKIEGMVSKEEAEKLWLPDVSILLVDDDEVSREVAGRTLEKFELKLDTATSGVGAIDMVLNNKYDVVFIDLDMPVMNGLETMREIRELDGDYANMAIIAMDTDAIEENKDRLLAGGFTDSILKPIDIRRAAALLKDCLPLSKIGERTNDMKDYIDNSRFSDGLALLKNVLSVEASLEKIGGSIDVFNKLIKIFYNQNSNASAELYEKQGKDIRGFRTKIHSIRTNSTNIGALKLAKEAAKMEAAINIGNREYVKDNLDEFVDLLLDVLLAIEDYQAYMDKLSGNVYESKGKEEMTDDSPESEISQPQSIDVNRLEDIKYLAFDEEFDAVVDEMDKLCQIEYVGEDEEFIQVLKTAVEEKDMAKIDELVTTYINLKS